MYTKFLSLGIILLLLFNGITTVSADDTIPPITFIHPDPPNPNGNNSWYVSNITITLIAIDEDSGVNITYYRIYGQTWQIYLEPFNLTEDGEVYVEYYSIDNAGNNESIKISCFNIDKIPPRIDLTWEMVDPPFLVIYTAFCEDLTSGMDKVEFYLKDILHKVDKTEPYTFETLLSVEKWRSFGLIYLKSIHQDYVSFFAFIVSVSPDKLSYEATKACAIDQAGNKDYDNLCPYEVIPYQEYRFRYLFTDMIVLNNFTGSINRFFINAVFSEYPVI